MRYADSIGKEIMQIRYSVVSGNLHIDTEEEKTTMITTKNKGED